MGNLPEIKSILSDARSESEILFEHICIYENIKHFYKYYFQYV